MESQLLLLLRSQGICQFASLIIPPHQVCMRVCVFIWFPCRAPQIDKARHFTHCAMRIRSAEKCTDTVFHERIERHVRTQTPSQSPASRAYVITATVLKKNLRRRRRRRKTHDMRSHTGTHTCKPAVCVAVAKPRCVCQRSRPQGRQGHVPLEVHATS